MSHSIREYLKHIRDEITYLLTETREIKRVDFLHDETRKRAYVRSLEIIGEATKKIPDRFRDEYPDIQWRSIAGLRDHLIHAYFGIDYDIVWDVITNHIPILSEAIVEMLQREDIQ